MSRALLFVSLLLTACANSELEITSNYNPELNEQQLSKWKTLIGKWYGKQPIKGGGVHEWLVDRKSDGTYEIHFRHHKGNGSIESKVEIGQWGTSGNVYFTIYRASVLNGHVYPTSTSDPYHYDAYHILSLTENEFEYQHARTGGRFKVRKVSADYSF